MSSAPNQRPFALRLGGLLLTVVPFAFGMIRFAETRSDTRYLWTAVASQLGAVVVSSMRGLAAHPTVMRMLAAFLASAGAAVLCALLLAVTFGPALVIVCCAFALCSATGTVLLWWRSAA